MTYMVISFVKLAGAMRASAFFSAITLPLLASIRMYPFASIEGIAGFITGCGCVGIGMMGAAIVQVMVLANAMVKMAFRSMNQFLNDVDNETGIWPIDAYLASICVCLQLALIRAATVRECVTVMQFKVVVMLGAVTHSLTVAARIKTFNLTDQN